jgi:hypothetical protein
MIKREESKKKKEEKSRKREICSITTNGLLKMSISERSP